jgi:hypothetical protein
MVPAVTAQENLDPVKLMPDTHKLLFENELARVLESKVPARAALSRSTGIHTASRFT